MQTEFGVIIMPALVHNGDQPHGRVRLAKLWSGPRVVHYQGCGIVTTFENQVIGTVYGSRVHISSCSRMAQLSLFLGGPAERFPRHPGKASMSPQAIVARKMSSR